MKKTFDKLHFIKTKNFCSAKYSVKRMREATDWEKVFSKDTFDK